MIFFICCDSPFWLTLILRFEYYLSSEWNLCAQIFPFHYHLLPYENHHMSNITSNIILLLLNDLKYCLKEIVIEN